MLLLGISGSLRQGSYNTALLRAAAEVAPPGVEIQVYDRLRAIPPYDDDVRAAAVPEPVLDLKRRIRDADGVLIASPEYNWGVPGVLKNAIDWVLRPVHDTPLLRKPVALMGASTGAMGTLRAQLQWRQSLGGVARLVFLPEVLVGHAQTRFDAEGRLVDETARELLRRLVADLAAAAEVPDLAAAG